MRLMPTFVWISMQWSWYFVTEVEVLYAYDPKEDDELKLRVGAIIKKVVKQEAGWFHGTTVDGDTGAFPDNFVKVSYLSRVYS